MRKKKENKTEFFTVINRSSETKTRTNSICRVKSKRKNKQTNKQTNRLEMTLVIVLHTKEKKRTYCNILITKREYNHRPRHRQRDSTVCTKYCFATLKHIHLKRDCMRDKALLYKKNDRERKCHSQKIKQLN
jgi:hypothetical protein